MRWQKWVCSLFVLMQCVCWLCSWMIVIVLNTILHTANGCIFVLGWFSVSWQHERHQLDGGGMLGLIMWMVLQNCTWVALTMIWLLVLTCWCGWFVNLQMQQCDWNGAAGGCTFCAAVVVVYLGRYAMSAVWSLVLTLCVSCDCLLGLL